MRCITGPGTNGPCQDSGERDLCTRRGPVFAKTVTGPFPPWVPVALGIWLVAWLSLHRLMRLIDNQSGKRRWMKARDTQEDVGKIVDTLPEKEPNR